MTLVIWKQLFFFAGIFDMLTDFKVLVYPPQMKREATNVFSNVTQTRTVAGQFPYRSSSSHLSEKKVSQVEDGPSESAPRYPVPAQAPGGSHPPLPASLVSGQQSYNQALVKLLVQQLPPVL